MTASTASKRGKAPEDRDLLAAACAIVAHQGWAGLTLRPLAEGLNVSVTVLSNHYGARAEVMAAICRAAHAEELQLFAGWSQTLVRLGPLSAPVATDLADTILEELAVRRRDFSLLFLEVLQTSNWDADLRAAFGPWLTTRMRFWAEFGKQAGLPAALADSGWLGGYCIDELAYSISLNPLPSYRMLRRLGLRRLFAGLNAPPDNRTDEALFGALFDALEYGAGDFTVTHGAEVGADWPGRAARACALALTERGVSALTHRAIAAEAGVPHTTLSYRFPTQQDLVVAGLEYIISHLLRAVDAGDLSGDLSDSPERVGARDNHGLDVGRATFAVAIAAARMPKLAACAADMRRSRGVNLRKILCRLSPAITGVDLLCAQITSVGLIGLSTTLPRGGGGDAGFVAAYDSVLAHLRRPQAFDQA